PCHTRYGPPRRASRGRVYRAGRSSPALLTATNRQTWRRTGATETRGGGCMAGLLERCWSAHVNGLWFRNDKTIWIDDQTPVYNHRCEQGFRRQTRGREGQKRRQGRG